MIKRESIQDLLSHVQIAEVVGDFVALKKRGTSYLGLCPFHTERTPSFTVSSVRNMYKCFGCGKGGSAITFLMEHEKLSYVEALRWLAKKYHFTLEETRDSEAQIQTQRAEESLAAVVAFAQDFFIRMLWESEDGKNIAQAYLAHRGMDEAQARHFMLGYAPDQPDMLVRELSRAQFNLDFALECGLIVQRQDRYEDNYRGRLMFPICNHFGKPIAFAGRILVEPPPESKYHVPKYINSPENLLYQKRKTLYNWHLARKAIAQHKTCILVEGYTDVMRLYEAGIEHVVASAGTALTADQLRLIVKQTDNICVLYDGDKAGTTASLRAIPLAIEEGLSPYFVSIPNNEDPDSYLRKEGREAFTNLLEKERKDFIEFRLLVAEKDEAASGNMEKKNELIRNIAEDISHAWRTQDVAKRHLYVQRAAELTGLPESAFSELVAHFLSEQRARYAREQTNTTVSTGATFTPSSLTLETRVSAWDYIEREALRLLFLYGHYKVRINTEDGGAGEPILLAHYMLDLFLDANNLMTHTARKMLIETYEQALEKLANDELPTIEYFIYHENAEVVKAFSEAGVLDEELKKEKQHTSQVEDAESDINKNEKRAEKEAEIKQKELEVKQKEAQDFAQQLFENFISFVSLRNLMRVSEVQMARIKSESDTELLRDHLRVYQEIRNKITTLAEKMGVSIVE